MVLHIIHHLSTPVYSYPSAPSQALRPPDCWLLFQMCTHDSHTNAVSGSGVACWRVEEKEMRFWSYLWVMRLENEVYKWPSLWHALTACAHDIWKSRLRKKCLVIQQLLIRSREPVSGFNPEVSCIQGKAYYWGFSPHQHVFIYSSVAFFGK